MSNLPSKINVYSKSMPYYMNALACGAHYGTFLLAAEFLEWITTLKPERRRCVEAWMKLSVDQREHVARAFQQEQGRREEP